MEGNKAEMARMIGLTVETVSQTEDRIHFKFTDGSEGMFYHDQDCCEYVRVEDVNGDWSDIEGTELLIADERVQDSPTALESGTWTFYTFRSIGGSVDVRWVGESNGYYSESVDFTFSPSAKNTAANSIWPKKDESGWFV